MATRSGLRPRKPAAEATSPTVIDTPTARKARKPANVSPAKVSPGEIISCVNQFRISSETLSSPILTPMQGMKSSITDSTKFDAFMDRNATPEESHANDAFMETPAPATSQPLYPNLEALTADTVLYPSLDKMESKTPARRRLYAPVTTGRRTTGRGAAGRKSLATQTVLPVTPTKPIDNSTVPKTTFEFKFSAGLEEAGKKVLEELKISSAALQAHMKDEAAKRALEVDLSSNAESSSTPARSRRFSAEHRKQFNKMASIADHYSAKRAKSPVKPTTPSPKKPDTREAKSTRAPKTLKRKNATEDESNSTSFMPPQTLSTSDTEMADESPISKKKARIDGTPMTQPRHKMAKFATPGPMMATPISKPLQAAGHQHGITRSTVVKQSAMKQSSLPRVIRKEAAPSTPSKPLAVATPLKKETLLASPSKVRPPGTLTKPATIITQPGTPSPVKISVPIATETFEFRTDIKAPVFDKEKLHKVAAAATSKPSVRFADLVEDEPLPPASSLPPARSLFDGGVVLKPTEKRKAVSQEEDDAEESVPKPAPTPARNKRVRMDIPELKHISATPAKDKTPASPVKSSSSVLATIARKVTQPVRNSRINQLAMPKKRTVLSPKTDGKKISKPRWK